MTKHVSKLAGLTASLFALAVTASADVKVNEHFSVNGYAVGSYTYTNPDVGTESDTTLQNGTLFGNTDAVKLGLLGTSGQFSAYGSVLYLPMPGNGSREAGILDAYVTYDTGAGLKITGGKFLSYLGYEAFDAPNMAQLTYGYTIFAVPAYHSGAKLDFATKTFSIGVAAVDSIFSGVNGFFEGDREIDNDVGFEVIATYTGIDKLTIFAGIAQEDTHNATNDLFIFDLWASYAVTDKLTIAGEYDVQEDVGEGWLAFVNYKFVDNLAVAFRVSGFHADGGGNDTKYTVAPTYTVSPNVSFRAEVSLAEGDVFGDYTFFGVQALFKF